MFAFADGRRSAMPSDFSAHVDLLAHLAGRCENVVIKTRLADVCWLLQRRRWELGTTAVAGYVDIVQRVDLGELKYRFDEAPIALTYNSRDYLQRALHIGRALGWDKPVTMAARSLATELRVRAAAVGGNHLVWFADLDLTMGISADTGVVGEEVERTIIATRDTLDPTTAVELWNLAPRACTRANRGPDANRCLSEAAETLAAQAEIGAGAMMTASLLSSAITQLSGVPDLKERRQELRQKLVDAQTRIPEEMSPFSHPIDLSAIVSDTDRRMAGDELLGKLCVFASLVFSPDPEELATRAREAIRSSPFAGLVTTSQLDREGKTVHRAGAAGLGGVNQEALDSQIAQLESIRRNIAASGAIESARLKIVGRHYISADVLLPLVQRSPAIPHELAGTFSTGFARFFQGDFISAAYILTPLLEAMMRHLMKAHGFDVSIFDDATQVQEDRTISSLYDQMRAEVIQVFGPPLATAIENVFLKKPGPYLRHALSHGLMTDASPLSNDMVYGCWLVFRMCMIPLIYYRDRIGLPPGWPEMEVSSMALARKRPCWFMRLLRFLGWRRR